MIPNSPLANGTRFYGDPLQSYINGSTPGLGYEWWELRTRGFFTNNLWNACGPSIGITPNSSGFLIARFTEAFQ
jgi:hypothetical protein